MGRYSVDARQEGPSYDTFCQCIKQRSQSQVFVMQYLYVEEKSLKYNMVHAIRLFARPICKSEIELARAQIAERPYNNSSIIAW